MLADVLFVCAELIAQELLEVCADMLQARDAIHHIAGKMKAIQFV